MHAADLLASPHSGASLQRVVIVGRPNVGKSALFNRIIGKRHAVVESIPGVTRDRLYHPVHWGGKRFDLIDTGGIVFGDDDPLVEQIRVQAEIALAQADVVLFVVDAEAGLMPSDSELANRLRSLKKPLIVCVNKADHEKRESWAAEFFALGFAEVLPISAIHGRGIAELLDRIVELLPDATQIESEESGVTLTILGRPNVGKSSLLNALCGEDRVIVSNIPGTTRDPIDTVIRHNDEVITVVDTAGLRRPGKIQGSVEYYMDLRAKRSLRRASLAIVVADGEEGLTSGDKRAAEFVVRAGRALVFAVNKWDRVEPPDGRPKVRSKPKKFFAARFSEDAAEFAWAPLCFTSALKHTGIDALLDTCLECLDNYSLRVTTGALNRVVRQAVAEVPPSSRGKPVRVYYATQVATSPPTVALFVNDPGRVHFSYLRFLENRLRDAFPLTGTPIRLLLRASHEEQGARKRGTRGAARRSHE
ncbi:MAG: ribosome biogenesis GTPase Der [Armatimonadota bacterium]